MKRTLIVGIISLIAGIAFADHPAVCFFVIRTQDARAIIEKQGVAGLTLNNLKGKIIASGHASAGSNIRIQTETLSLSVDIHGTGVKDQYEYQLSLRDKQNTNTAYSLNGVVTIGKEPSLAEFPIKWDYKEVTVFFQTENLKL